MERAFPGAHLTLVEPVPWLEAYVRHNFARNNVPLPQFHSAICSVRSATGRSEFGVQAKGTQDSRVVPQRGATVVETGVVTLDDLCADIAPEDGVYIKIDTQGWEERVFSGGEAFLSNHKRWFAKSEFAPQWLESQGTDPVALLQWLLARYSVHESVGRVRYGCTSLDEAIGPPLAPGCESQFVNYVRNLALNDRGWIDLFILPLPDKRGFGTGAAKTDASNERP
jgi:FkbM family methyltransferase